VEIPGTEKRPMPGPNTQIKTRARIKENMRMFDTRELFSRMSLEEKAGQLVMQDFVGRWEVPQDVTQGLAEGAIGSILYFSGCNVIDSYQLRILTEKVQTAARSGPWRIPAFIAIDQEGGQLAPITTGISIHPGNMALAAIAENEAPRYAEKAGEITGKELASIGITCCFAPVVDLCEEEGLPVKDNRYFGSDPQKAATLARAFVQGLQKQGVMGCAKHFPGQRNVDIDSHFELDVVPYTYERLKNREWIPFQAAIDGGVAMMMTLHAAYPQLDPSGLPATLSPVILQEYLRKKLGYQGLVISDDIQMKPIKDTYGIEGALIRAIQAGVDIVIVSAGVREANRIIAEAVRKGHINEDRFNESVLRVLDAKKQWIKEEFPTEKERKKVCAIPVHLKTVQEAADKSLTLIKNSAGLLPLKPSPNQRIVILRPTMGRLVMSDNTNFYTHSFKDIFQEYFPHQKIIEYSFGLEPNETEILGAQDWAFMADYVIFCTYNAYQFRKQLELLQGIQVFAKKDKLITLVVRSPQDLVEVAPKVETLVLTYGVAECSLRAAARLIKGDIAPRGSLPVGVGLQEQEKERMFPRGTGIQGW
jgi:beta-N-acetylhexosaminidase